MMLAAESVSWVGVPASNNVYVYDFTRKHTHKMCHHAAEVVVLIDVT